MTGKNCNASGHRPSRLPWASASFSDRGGGALQAGSGSGHRQPDSEEIAAAILKGAEAFLARQYRTIVVLSCWPRPAIFAFSTTINRDVKNTRRWATAPAFRVTLSFLARGRLFPSAPFPPRPAVAGIGRVRVYPCQHRTAAAA